LPIHKHILLATLGGQPQIITFTLDLLLATFPITDVIVLHPKASEERLQRSLTCLRLEFASDYYRTKGHTIHFRSHSLQLDGNPINDIIDDRHADGTLDTIHQLIGELKLQEHHIHLSVTGGRRLISLLAIAVATLNFDRDDHIWHLYTPKEIQERADEGTMMHVSSDAGINLIQGQFMFLGAYIHNPAQSFRSSQEKQQLQIEAQERAYCTDVVNKATPARLKVLRAFARGLRPQQVADELCIALVTVHTHKTALLDLCHNVWNIPLEERLDYHFLRAKFASYFQNDE
jgi:CRISPR-associated protein Csx14